MKKYKISPISFYRRVDRRTLIQDFCRVIMGLVVVTVFLLNTTSHAQKCATNLTGPALHENIGRGEITLTPLTRQHRKKLLHLFTITDVNSFFLGGDSPDRQIQYHLVRAAKALKTQRQNFEGLWMIQYRGALAGFIMMTKAKPIVLSQEHLDRFPEETPNDLDLVVGYAVDSAFRGKGIATQALNIALAFAASQLNARYVFASANKLNEPSKVVLLRSGFEIFPHSDIKRNKFFKRLKAD